MLYQVIAYVCPLKRISCLETLLSALPPSSTPQVDAPNAMISDSMEMNKLYSGKGGVLIIFVHITLSDPANVNVQTMYRSLQNQ